MNIWTVLEIDCCRDKDLIRNAYREKLTRTNPEDSPEEFKELRAAYEEALKYADSEEVAEVKDESPIGQFIQKAEDIYNSFSRRMSLAEWKELLQMDVCYALDTKLEARNRLLEFLMDHYRLPMKVWNMLNDTFDFKENKEELLELFPTNFIEYAVFGGMQSEIAIPLKLFKGPDDADYDQYISLYFQSTEEIDERNMDEAVKCLDQMEQTGIHHPYQEINRIRVILNSGEPSEYEEAAARAKALYETYPDDDEVTLYVGETAFFLEQPELAREYFEKVLKMMPQHFLARYRLAGCLALEGKYDEAKDAYAKLLDEYPNQQAVIGELTELNKKLTETYKERWEKDKQDVEAAEELAWCYLQNSQIDEGLELIGQFSPAAKDRFIHLNLCGRLYLEHEEYEKALTYFKKWEEQGKSLTDDGSEEVKKELGRKELPIYLQAVALMGLKNYAEALSSIERSLAIKRDPEALYYKALILYRQEDWQAAASVCDEMTEISTQDSNAYILRGKCYYEMEYYQDAYDDFEAALSIYHYQLDPHIYKGRILLHYNQYDEAKELVQSLEEDGAVSDRIQILKANILAESDQEAARKLFLEVIQKYEAGESDMDQMHVVYLDLAVMLQSDASLDELMGYIEKGKEIKPNYQPLLDYQAFQYRKHSHLAQALKCYEQLLAINPDHYEANYNIASIWFDQQKYEKALHYFTRDLAVGASGNGFEMRGRTLIKLGRMDEALNDFKEAINMDPEEEDHYYFAALTYFYLNQLNEALQTCEQTIEMAESKDRPFSAAFVLKAQICARLRRYQDAIAARHKSKELDNDPEELLEICDLYFKAGEYDNGAKILEQWRNTPGASDVLQRYPLKRATYSFLLGDLRGGYKLLKKSNSDAFERAQGLFEYYINTGAPAKAGKIARQIIDSIPDIVTGYLWLAMSAFEERNLALAREMAVKVLDMLAAKGPSPSCETRNLGHAVCCYAILGDTKRAQEYIQRAFHGRLCNHCEYCYCKDAHLAAGFFYESVQDYKRAMSEYERAMEICKDDPDLVLRTERLKKRARL